MLNGQKYRSYLQIHRRFRAQGEAGRTWMQATPLPQRLSRQLKAHLVSALPRYTCRMAPRQCRSLSAFALGYRG